MAYSPEPLDYLNHVNYSRKVAGLYGLCTDSMLTEKAQIHSDAMAAAGYNFHSSNLLANVPPGTLLVVENVGTGYSLIQLHIAFLASPLHAANIYNNRLTHAGVGITRSGVKMFMVVIGISNYTYGCNL